MSEPKYRVGQIMAGDVAVGDVLLQVPWIDHAVRWDRAWPIGTVLHVHTYGETRSWTVETRGGDVIRHPGEPVNRGVLTTVHVPGSHPPPPDLTEDKGTRCRCPIQACAHREVTT